MVILAVAYSAIVPAFEAPDEPGHYSYIQSLWATHSLPVQGTEDPLQPEFSQPPLYYVGQALAGALVPAGADNLPAWEHHNLFQNTTAAGNVNLYAHLPAEAFPWTGSVLRLHAMRLLNVALAALTVLATYGAARELGLAPMPSLIAAGSLAFLPEFLFVTGVLNADNAVTALSASSLCLLLRWLRRRPSWRLAGLLGLCAGLAALAKLSGLAVIGAMLLAMLARALLQPRLACGSAAADGHAVPSAEVGPPDAVQTGPSTGEARVADMAPPSQSTAAASDVVDMAPPSRSTAEAEVAGMPKIDLSAARSYAGRIIRANIGSTQGEVQAGAGAASAQGGVPTRMRTGMGQADLGGTAWRTVLAQSVLAGVLAIGVCGWWYVRNQVLYGDALGWNVMLAAVGDMLRARPLSLPAAARVLVKARATAWAVFGWTNLRLPEPVYWALDALTVAALAGLALAPRGWRKLVQHRRVALARLVLVLWPLPFAASLVRWVAVNSAAAQWRLLLPAFPALAILLVVGLRALAGRREWLLAIVPSGLLALSLGSLVWVIGPAYRGPMTTSAPIAHAALVHFGPDLDFLGYDDPVPPDAKPGSTVTVNLFWRARQPVSYDAAVALAAIDAGSALQWKETTWPDQGRAATILWPAGQIVRDRHEIVLAGDAPAGERTLLLSLFDPDHGGTNLPATDASGQRLQADTTTLGRFLVSPAAAPQPATAARAPFDGGPALVGYSLRPSPGTLDVGLVWQAGQRSAIDYTVFVHLTDPAGKLVGQHDGQPGEGRFPFTLLSPGTQVEDDHALALTAPLSGPFVLRVGLYDLATGRRLALAGTDSTETAFPVQLGPP